MSITEQITSFIKNVIAQHQQVITYDREGNEVEMELTVFYHTVLQRLTNTIANQEYVLPRLAEINPCLTNIEDDFQTQVLPSFIDQSPNANLTHVAEIKRRIRQILTAKVEKIGHTIDFVSTECANVRSDQVQQRHSYKAIGLFKKFLAAPWQILPGLPSSIGESNHVYQSRKGIEKVITKALAPDGRTIPITMKKEKRNDHPTAIQLGTEIGDNGLSWLEKPMFTNTFEAYLELRLLLLTLEQLSETENE